MLDFLSAAAAAGGPPGWTSLVLPIGLIAVFWFMLIRPQMKRQKEHQARIASVKKGDQVVTGGGLVGKVIKVDDVYAEIELAQGVKVKAVKSTITDIVPPGGTAAND
jgi:preprotein translocase subunit YajC